MDRTKIEINLAAGSDNGLMMFQERVQLKNGCVTNLDAAGYGSFKLIVSPTEIFGNLTQTLSEMATGDKHGLTDCDINIKNTLDNGFFEVDVIGMVAERAIVDLVAVHDGVIVRH